MSEIRPSDAFLQTGKTRDVPFPFAPIGRVRYNLAMIATRLRDNHSSPKTGVLPARAQS